jgi:hypothetical protein
LIVELMIGCGKTPKVPGLVGHLIGLLAVVVEARHVFQLAAGGRGQAQFLADLAQVLVGDVVVEDVDRQAVGVAVAVVEVAAAGGDRGQGLAARQAPVDLGREAVVLAVLVLRAVDAEVGVLGRGLHAATGIDERQGSDRIDRVGRPGQRLVLLGVVGGDQDVDRVHRPPQQLGATAPFVVAVETAAVELVV